MVEEDRDREETEVEMLEVDLDCECEGYRVISWRSEAYRGSTIVGPSFIVSVVKGTVRALLSAFVLIRRAALEVAKDISRRMELLYQRNRGIIPSGGEFDRLQLGRGCQVALASRWRC